MDIHADASTPPNAVSPTQPWKFWRAVIVPATSNVLVPHVAPMGAPGTANCPGRDWWKPWLHPVDAASMFGTARNGCGQMLGRRRLHFAIYRLPRQINRSLT